MKEVFMEINTIMEKYNITGHDINVITECILSNQSLSYLASYLNSTSEKQAYVFAKVVSEEIFQEELDSTAPQMVLDRIAIAESEKETIEQKIERARADKANRIIAEDRALFEAEQMQKILAMM
jgi:hypothetical protein